MKKPVVDEEKCIGCGACASVCPVSPKIMEIRDVPGKGGKAVIVHAEICDNGGACVRACPTGAFKLVYSGLRKFWNF